MHAEGLAHVAAPPQTWLLSSIGETSSVPAMADATTDLLFLRISLGTTSFTLWAVGLPVATYLAVELSWLLLFFLLDPSYPWFLFYTRPHA